MKMNECAAPLPRRRRAAGLLERLLSILLCLECFTWFWCLAALTWTDAFGQQAFFFSPPFTAEWLIAALMKSQKGPWEGSILVRQTYSLARGSRWASFSWWTWRSLKIGKQQKKINYCIINLFSFIVLNISIFLYVFEKASQWQTSGLSISPLQFFLLCNLFLPNIASQHNLLRQQLKSSKTTKFEHVPSIFIRAIFGSEKAHLHSYILIRDVSLNTRAPH